MGLLGTLGGLWSPSLLFLPSTLLPLPASQSPFPAPLSSCCSLPLPGAHGSLFWSPLPTRQVSAAGTWSPGLLVRRSGPFPVLPKFSPSVCALMHPISLRLHAGGMALLEHERGSRCSQIRGWGCSGPVPPRWAEVLPLACQTGLFISGLGCPLDFSS